MLAKHVDDDMPSFLMIDVDGKCGDGVFSQRYKRRLNWVLRFWLLLLSPRAWTGHVPNTERTKWWKFEAEMMSRP